VFDSTILKKSPQKLMSTTKLEGKKDLIKIFIVFLDNNDGMYMDIGVTMATWNGISTIQ